MVCRTDGAGMTGIAGQGKVSGDERGNKQHNGTGYDGMSSAPATLNGNTQKAAT